MTMKWVFVCFVAIQTLFDYLASVNVDTIMFRERTSGPSGAEVCSIDAPSQIPKGVRSKAECSLRCLQEPSCSGVNWRTSITCEMFFYPTDWFIKVAGCVHLYKVRTLIMKNNIAGSNSYFFNRSWAEFEQPFGDPTSQYWIGLERLHELSQKNCAIRIDLQMKTNGSWRYADYSRFSVGSASDKYRLTIGGYSGNAGDAMAYHDGQQFTTYDSDNDAWPYGNCATVPVSSIHNGAGFWYGWCYLAGITCSPYTLFVWNPPLSPIYGLSACLVSTSC